MKSNCLLILSLCLWIGVASCGGVKNDPVEIAQAAIKCINKGDFVGIKKFWSSSTISASMDHLQEAYDTPSEVNERDAERAKDVVEAEYTLQDQSIDEDRAKIEFKKQTASGKSTIAVFLEKTDGQWYIRGIN